MRLRSTVGPAFALTGSAPDIVPSRDSQAAEYVLEDPLDAADEGDGEVPGVLERPGDEYGWDDYAPGGAHDGHGPAQEERRALGQ